MKRTIARILFWSISAIVVCFSGKGLYDIWKIVHWQILWLPVAVSLVFLWLWAFCEKDEKK